MENIRKNSFLTTQNIFGRVQKKLHQLIFMCWYSEMLWEERVQVSALPMERTEGKVLFGWCLGIVTKCFVTLLENIKREWPTRLLDFLMYIQYQIWMKEARIIPGKTDTLFYIFYWNESYSMDSGAWFLCILSYRDKNKGRMVIYQGPASSSDKYILTVVQMTSCGRSCNNLAMYKRSSCSLDFLHFISLAFEKH